MVSPMPGMRPLKDIERFKPIDLHPEQGLRNALTLNKIERRDRLDQQKQQQQQKQNAMADTKLGMDKERMGMSREKLGMAQERQNMLKEEQGIKLGSLKRKRKGEEKFQNALVKGAGQGIGYDEDSVSKWSNLFLSQGVDPDLMKKFNQGMKGVKSQKQLQDLRLDERAKELGDKVVTFATQLMSIPKDDKDSTDRLLDAYSPLITEHLLKPGQFMPDENRKEFLITLAGQKFSNVKELRKVLGDRLNNGQDPELKRAKRQGELDLSATRSLTLENRIKEPIRKRAKQELARGALVLLERRGIVKADRERQGLSREDLENGLLQIQEEVFATIEVDKTTGIGKWVGRFKRNGKPVMPSVVELFGYYLESESLKEVTREVPGKWWGVNVEVVKKKQMETLRGFRRYIRSGQWKKDYKVKHPRNQEGE